jgi:hypothetical protein
MVTFEVPELGSKIDVGFGINKEGLFKIEIDEKEKKEEESDNEEQD